MDLEARKRFLYKRYEENKSAIFSVEECEWMAYFESLKSRGDAEHAKGSDPIVGALVRNPEGKILGLAHRAISFEGDHAEFSLLKGVLNGIDLSGCEIFTTLEPCVDDVRSGAGVSCSSIICSTPINVVHIGILDPNPKVYAKGITLLFERGRTVIPFSPEVQDAIACSCPAFRKESLAKPAELRRVNEEVFRYFDQKGFEQYLRDLAAARNDGLPFDFEEEKSRFASNLLKKKFISFDARNLRVDDSVQIMFYDSAYLKSSARQIKIQNEELAKPDLTISVSLPLAVKSVNELLEKGEFGMLDNELFREAIANAIIHRDYANDAPLLYIRKSKGRLVITNKASDNIPSDLLKHLETLDAPSYPGNGAIADFFNLARYCERSNKGTRTFKTAMSKPKIKVDGKMVEVTIGAIKS